MVLIILRQKFYALQTTITLLWFLKKILIFKYENLALSSFYASLLIILNNICKFVFF